MDLHEILVFEFLIQEMLIFKYAFYLCLYAFIMYFLFYPPGMYIFFLHMYILYAHMYTKESNVHKRK